MMVKTRDTRDDSDVRHPHSVPLLFLPTAVPLIPVLVCVPSVPSITRECLSM